MVSRGDDATHRGAARLFWQMFVPATLFMLLLQFTRCISVFTRASAMYNGPRRSPQQFDQLPVAADGLPDRRARYVVYV